MAAELNEQEVGREQDVIRMQRIRMQKSKQEAGQLCVEKRRWMMMEEGKEK